MLTKVCHQKMLKKPEAGSSRITSRLMARCNYGAHRLSIEMEKRVTCCTKRRMGRQAGCLKASFSSLSTLGALPKLKSSDS